MSDAVFEQVREQLAGVAGEAAVAHGVLALLIEPTRLTISAAGVSGVSPRVGDAALTWNAWSWGVEEDTGP